MPRYATSGPLDTVYAEETDTFFLTMNGRLRPDQLQPGQVAMSVNGRMDVDGSWQPRKGLNAKGEPLATSASEALTIPFYLYASKTISSATRSTTTVTITTSTAHGFTTATQVGISDVTGTFDPAGNHTITVTGSDTFTYQLAGATGSETYTLGASPSAGAPFITALNSPYGSCTFSNPTDSNSQYIIQALSTSAVATNMDTLVATTIAYPAGISISSEVAMIQAFDKVYIFRSGATALEWNGTLSGSPAFVKVANGDYTQPLVLTAANNAACTNGVVTITNTHNLSVGDKVTIMDEGSTGLVRFDVYTVASVSTTVSFTFYASVDNFTATSVVLGFRQSNGRGYTHMPAPAWAAYHQRRFIAPFTHTTSGSSGSETVTARNIQDEIIVSDIADPETYDILQNNYRITAGIADHLVAIHPFADDNAIAFNRNSLHLISGLSGSLADLSIKEITREVGLVARKSVVTIGNSIYFLSDNGVYSTEFGDLYNLRGAGKPLSDAITPIIKRINGEYAYRAVGAFYDNRYWLAVPIDGSTTNNAILVYNVLNGGWESLDTVNAAGWDVANLLTASPNGLDRLYVVAGNGGIHEVDSREDDSDVVFTYPGIDAVTVRPASYVTTRQYIMGSTARKRFKEFELHVESTDTNTSDATISAETENMDSTVSIGTVASLNSGSNVPVSEDASLRGRIGGVRGYGLQFTFTPTVGRPKLRMVKLSADEAQRSNTSAT